MTEVADVWMNAWDAIVTEALKVSELNEHVEYGEKTAPEYAPSAYVVPGPIDIIPATSIDNYYIMQFIVQILSRQANLKEGYKESLQLALKVHDQIKDDRSLNGVVDKTEMRITPDTRKSQLENAWMNLIVTCTYMGT